MLSVPSQPGENRGERLGEFESRSVKTRYAVEGFHLLENSYTSRHVIFVLHSAMKTHF